MQRGFARIMAVVGALSLSCGSARAGMLDSLFSSGLPIPIPGVGSFRVSQGRRSPAQQTPRMVAGQVYNEGIQLSRLNRLQESRMKFEQAIRIDPSFEMAWAALVGSCMTSGALDEGLAVGNQFIANFPHSSRRKETELIMQKLQEQLDRKNEIFARVGRDGADNYFGLATEGKNFYGWNLNAMPLKVYIAEGHGVRGYSANDATILNNSFAEWTSATENHITFTRVDSQADANIECVWIDDPKDFPQNRGMEAGEAVPTCDSDGYIIHSKLFLLTRGRKDGKSVDDLVMHTVCLHEIGHTLGLLGHSDNPGDVMYFTANGQRVQEPHLTQRDVNTLAKLYAKILDNRNGVVTGQSTPNQLPPQTAMDQSQTGMYQQTAMVQPQGSIQQPEGGLEAPQSALEQRQSGLEQRQTTVHRERTVTVKPQSPMQKSKSAMLKPQAASGRGRSAVNPSLTAMRPSSAVVKQPEPRAAIEPSSPNAVSLPAQPGLPQPFSNGMVFVSNVAAVNYYEQASAAAPNNMTLLDDLGTAYDNYGIELANMNDVRKAEKYFNLAYAIHRNSPDRSKLRNTVANFMQLLHFEKRDTEAAQIEANLEQVTARLPRN